mgnify:CR=1 FL=1
MRIASKATLINICVITASILVLLFSLVSSWAIMHESALIMNTLAISSNAVIGWSVVLALVLLWLNSLLIDSVTWTIARYWYKGDRNE